MPAPICNLTIPIVTSNLQAMEVHLNPEQASKLAQLASDRGRDADSLVQEAISRYLEEEAHFLQAVKLGESQLERGEYLTHEEVGSRIERMLKS
jgi:predicted transcriptional regulator